MSRTLNLLSAGAAQGLIRAVQGDFEQRHDCRIQGRFGAVGAIKEALLAGEPCDVLVLTRSLVDGLVADGRLRGDSRAELGSVRTGVAVPRGRPRPAVSTPEQLRTALLAAEAVYIPDPQRATAGIHFVRVLQQLGIEQALQPRLRAFANGATAMGELARCGLASALGCTQLTEILYTDGVEPVAPLPPPFELVTPYTAAVTVQARAPDLAAALLASLCAPANQAVREGGGFEA